MTETKALLYRCTYNQNTPTPRKGFLISAADNFICLNKRLVTDHSVLNKLREVNDANKFKYRIIISKGFYFLYS